MTCISGIHYDAITEREIEEVLDTAMALVTKAARRLENWSLRQNLFRPTGLYARVTSGLESILDEIDLFMGTDLGRTVDEPPNAEGYTNHFHDKVLLFAPLYLSNACPNDCAYCGFRRSARFERKKLGIEEAVEEARHLVRQGHRTIDLVTSEISTDRFVDYVCEVIEQILKTTATCRIHLNLGALSQDQYSRLRSAGATGYHLYQETYHPEPYFEVHRSGLKRDMAHRLEAPHRAMESGFKRIGLGLLLGLGPMRDDLARLVRHGQIVTNDYPDVQLGFSLPRFRQVDEACDYTVAGPVSDDQFVKAMMFLRLKFPEAHLTLTTRERPDIRDRLIPLGVTKVSAGVSTRPGGYVTGDRHATAQFSVSDERPLADIVDVIQGAGLTAVYE